LNIFNHDIIPDHNEINELFPQPSIVGLIPHGLLQIVNIEVFSFEIFNSILDIQYSTPLRHTPLAAP